LYLFFNCNQYSRISVIDCSCVALSSPHCAVATTSYSVTMAGRVHSLGLLVVAALLLVLACGVSAQAQAPQDSYLTLGANLGVTSAPDYASWYTAASANLSMWRNELFEKTMAVSRGVAPGRSTAQTRAPALQYPLHEKYCRRCVDAWRLVDIDS
jgi:hypothetical protein